LTFPVEYGILSLCNGPLNKLNAMNSNAKYNCPTFQASVACGNLQVFRSGDSALIPLKALLILISLNR
jgi:hypothetical protein